MNQEIVFVVARADNGIIGKDGALPWHIPADLRHFKQLTLGTPMIMGRTTFESFPRPLPGRRHIVLTRDPTWRRDGAEPAATARDALALAGPGRVSVIGGAQIYALFLDRADAIELTQIHMAAAGDTSMPGFDPDMWREVSRQDHPAVDSLPSYSWVRLERA